MTTCWGTLWMDSGDYPARDRHVEAHQRVLASRRDVQAQVMQGERQIARDLAIALRDWFPEHTAHMVLHWFTGWSNVNSAARRWCSDVSGFRPECSDVIHATGDFTSRKIPPCLAWDTLRTMF